MTKRIALFQVEGFLSQTPRDTTRFALGASIHPKIQESSKKSEIEKIIKKHTDALASEIHGPIMDLLEEQIKDLKKSDQYIPMPQKAQKG